MTDKEYVVPDVWKLKQVDNKFSAINRPSAGARFEAELPKGEFSIQLYSLGTPNVGFGFLFNPDGGRKKKLKT